MQVVEDERGEAAIGLTGIPRNLREGRTTFLRDALGMPLAHSAVHGSLKSLDRVRWALRGEEECGHIHAIDTFSGPRSSSNVGRTT